MDGTHFDSLIKRLAATPVTRAAALRGLAASAAALAGVTLLAESGTADGDGKKTRKRRVCDCSSSDPNSCTNRRLKRRAANRLLRSNACAYKGRCTGVSGCAAPAPVGCNPANNTQGNCPTGQVCNTRAICVTAVGCLYTANPQCSTNQVCCPSESASAGECRGTLQAC